jgi:hypothetical protein
VASVAAVLGSELLGFYIKEEDKIVKKIPPNLPYFLADSSVL